MTFRLSLAAEDDIIGIAKEGVRLFGPAPERLQQMKDGLARWKAEGAEIID